MENNQKIAVGCIRVSTDKQDATAQEARIRKWCDINGYMLAAVWGKTDEGESATLPVEMREVEHAIEDAISRQAVCVFDSLDRLSRIVPDLYAVANRVLKAGANIICLADGMDLRELWHTAFGKAVFGMRAVFAQFERDLVSERTRKLLANTRENGFRNGCVRYGWMEDRKNPQVHIRKDGSTKTRYPLVVNPAEQAVISRIQELAGKGRGPTAIARALRKEGVVNRRGIAFSPQSIWNLLAAL